jgi:hypothetical protein
MPVEFVDELPGRAPGGSARNSFLIPIITELVENPGKWAKVAKYENAQSGYVNAARWNKRWKSQGVIFRSRKEDDGGVQIYGRYDPTPPAV